LKSWPPGDELYTVFTAGQTLLECEIESDRPFQLKWYKNGVEVDLDKIRVPLWSFKFRDGSGAVFWQWPYHKDFLNAPATYECRATNGADEMVSKKVKYTPLEGEYN